MGFTLKKIISSILMPLPIWLILSIIGIYYLYKKRYNLSKFFLISSTLFLTLISYTPVSNALLSPLENSYSKLEKIPKNISHILLLGGDRESRGWELLKIYHQLPNSKIITSGYEGNDKIPEAIRTEKILVDIGILKQNIIVHSEPKDTKEEAIAIKRLLGKKPFILITSAYHMPRAIMLFKKEGLNPIPAPTDYKIKSYSSLLSLPNISALKKTEIAWHEYLGLLWEKIKNKINS